MIVFYTIERCTHCKRFVDARFFWLRTGLGPLNFECGRCGRTFASGRREWTEFTPARKIGYWVISLVYALVIGFLCLMATAVAMGALGASDATTKLYSRMGLGAGAAIVLMAQFIRIRTSKARAAIPNTPPHKPGFFGTTTNLQLQVLLVWIAVFAAGLAALMIRSPTPAS